MNVACRRSRAFAGRRCGVTERSEGNPRSGLTPQGRSAALRRRRQATRDGDRQLAPGVQAGGSSRLASLSWLQSADPGKVRRCSSRRCLQFAPIWAADTRRRPYENLKTLKLTVMFSVTAPGKDVFPFDPAHCKHAAGVPCSGRIGCHVYADSARSFNQKVSPWWSELHRAAKLRADRATGFKGTIAARVWEKQKRGLAHMHGVLSVSTPAELRWAEAYVTALVELAPSKGFGFVDGWAKISQKIKPGIEAAAYLSGYFVKGKGRKASLTENVQDADLPRLLVFVGRGLTAKTACTMRNLRVARWLWASRDGRCPPPDVSLEGWLAAAYVLQRRGAAP